MQIALSSAERIVHCSVNVRQASDGYALHYRHWIPSSPPRGWLLALHGIQSHSGWYEYSGNCFAQAGWNVRIPDRRGSGQNTEQRGDAVHEDRLIGDVRHFLMDMHRERLQSGSNSPILLAGISWGAGLALEIARKSPDLLDGVTFITPGIFSPFEPNLLNRMQIRLARLLNIQQRRVRIPLGDASLFTSCPEHQNFIRHDSLALHQMTLSLLYASQKLNRRARKKKPVLLPLQLILAAQDRIIDNQKTKSHFHRIAGKSISILEYFGVQHTLELESCRDHFVEDWIQWCNQRPRISCSTQP